MKTKSRRAENGPLFRRPGNRGSRRHRRQKLLVKLPATSVQEEAVLTEAPPAPARSAPTEDLVTAEGLEMLMVESVAQLSENYDFVEALACGLFDQLPPARPLAPAVATR